MRVNIDTVLRLAGSDAVLVPYNRSHVVTYHGWMGDEELLRLTCSERLSLEEEYENQQSWREDEKKLTFIVLDQRRDCAMAGDVNLYMNEGDEGAEIEVMIAEVESRRRGLARDALTLMMAYANEKLEVERFVAKILMDNTPSLRLFDKLGFQLVRNVPAFGETHLALDVGTGAGVLLVSGVRDKWAFESYAASELSARRFDKVGK